MKAFFVVGLLISLARGSEAQVRSQSFAPAPAVSLGAIARPVRTLGTSNASSRPLGGVALPTFPSTGTVRHGKHATATSRYIGPIYYVPNAFDDGYDANATDAPPAPPRRVVVNQYFSAPEPVRPAEENYRTSASEGTVNPGDPIGPVENYYLIAYKDHTIYSALAYWVEGETLHYVTMQNKHNQASVELIDVEQTTKLNSDRAVPFSLNGN